MAEEKLDLLIYTLDCAMNGDNYSNFLDKLIPSKEVVEPKLPLKLVTLIEICKKENSNFIVEIGHYGEECESLLEYITKNEICPEIYFLDFYNDLGDKEIIFTNINNTKSIIYR